ncbi:MAG: tetratricopeptide repeat protein [Bacteroidia bacterium]|nr:tetratricopeptide repeat protein [Bacteroidia bacterium]
MRTMVLLVVIAFSASCSKRKSLNNAVGQYQTKLDSAFFHRNSGDIDSALTVFNTLENLSGTPGQMGIMHNARAGIYYNRFDYPKALVDYLVAHNHFTDIADSLNVANTSLNIGLCYKKIGLFERASVYLKDASIYFDQRPENQLQITSIATLLGNIYREIEDYPLSIHYHRKALQLLRDQEGWAYIPSLNNLGNTYFQMDNQLDSAKSFFRQYLSLSTLAKDTIKMARANQNLARVALLNGESDSALMFLRQSRLLYEQQGHLPGLITQNIIESQALIPLDAKLALERAQVADSQAKQLAKPRERVKALELLEEIHLKMKHPDLAYSASLLHKRLRDSLDDKRKIAQIYSYERSHQVAFKNNELKRERDRRQSLQRIHNLFILVVTLLVVALYLLWLRYRSKKRFVEEYFSSESSIILKSGKRIEFSSILRVETLRNDLIIITINGERLVEKKTTLKSFIPVLPKILFGRPQHGIVINYSFVAKVMKTKVDLLETRINVTEKYRDKFIEGWNSYKEIYPTQNYP